MNIKYSFIGLLLVLSLQMNAQERVKGQKVKFNIPGSSYGIIKEGFLNPPVSATPGVYWYFMDGNIS
ncbi:MAG: hypothetical protein Q8859_12115, partial [Bacteroidota bacterium]|nr:hypothetical protein [Bacteroidota bacterium]